LEERKKKGDIWSEERKGERKTHFLCENGEDGRSFAQRKNVGGDNDVFKSAL